MRTQCASRARAAKGLQMHATALIQDEIETYIRQGPLWNKTFLKGTAAPSLSEWLTKGHALQKQLYPRYEAFPPSLSIASRIFHLYLPIYFWLRGVTYIHNLSREKAQHATIVGISAPQGSGKTILCRALQTVGSLDQLKIASLSIDDFYLRRSELTRVQAKYPTNKLYRVRGNAGTHDIPLGQETLAKCKTLCSGDRLRLPSYDKSLYSGEGDRKDAADWPEVSGRLDLVLLEGWMLGFQPLAAGDAALRNDGDLQDVNAALGQYSGWTELIDAWIIVEVADTEQIYEWRLEAEREMRQQKGEAFAMRDEEVKDFVAAYMPAYSAYLPGLYRNVAVDGKLTLRLCIDKSRKVIA